MGRIYEERGGPLVLVAVRGSRQAIQGAHERPCADARRGQGAVRSGLAAMAGVGEAAGNAPRGAAAKGRQRSLERRAGRSGAVGQKGLPGCVRGGSRLRAAQGRWIVRGARRGANYKWLGSRDRSVRMRPVFRREAPAQLHHDRMRCDRNRRRNYLRLPNPRLRNRRGRPHAQRGRGDNSQTGDLDLTHCGSPFVPWKHLNLAENPPPACDRCHKVADFAEPRALPATTQNRPLSAQRPDPEGFSGFALCVDRGPTLAPGP